MSLIGLQSPESQTIDQACAVPYRRRTGRLEFCLITSSAGRWKFPKGIVDPGETFAETALKEALEEAGLHGRIVGAPLGCYEIAKKARLHTVVALVMKVVRVDEQWDESHRRQRQWVSPRKARSLFSEPELQAVLSAAVDHIHSS